MEQLMKLYNELISTESKRLYFHVDEIDIIMHAFAEENITFNEWFDKFGVAKKNKIILGYLRCCGYLGSPVIKEQLRYIIEEFIPSQRRRHNPRPIYVEYIKKYISFANLPENRTPIEHKPYCTRGG